MKELLRHGLRTAVTVLLRVRSRPYPVSPDGRCVVIAPHQDDEALGCAGLILARRTAGLPVSIIYLTDGAASHPGHPCLSPADLAQLRRAEARQAMQRLGVPDSCLDFIDAPDGTLAHLSQDAFEYLARRLAARISLNQPTEMFLPCRDDGSSEHTAAYRITRRALHLAGLVPRLLEYPVWAWWSPQRLARVGMTSQRVWRLSFAHAASRKRDALACYVTQGQPTPPWPQAVLPAGFVDCFANGEEYFFESSP